MTTPRFEVLPLSERWVVAEMERGVPVHVYPAVFASPESAESYMLFISEYRRLSVFDVDADELARVADCIRRKEAA